MKTKKLLSLILLGLLCSIGNVWGDETIFSFIVNSSGSDVTVERKGGTVNLTTTNTFSSLSGGTVTMYDGNTSSGNAEKVVGTDNSERHVRFPNTNICMTLVLSKALAKGDVITYKSNANTEIYFTTSRTRATTIGTTSKSYTIPAESSLIGVSTVYVWPGSTSTKIKEFTIVRPGAGAPSFSPVSGSSVAEGSKIIITSSNSTSIKYKWTSSSETPADGWSPYDAEAKVAVPSAAAGTSYLHAQGFKGEEAGPSGYSQYTITSPDTDAPTLSNTSPANSETNVTVSGNIVLTFNENIVCTTNATLTPFGGDPIALTPSVSGTTVTYAYENLDNNLTHTFNLAANSVADGSGNQYASAINFSFTTEQETCATPTFTVYGNKVVQISCATDGATIYYGGADVKTGTKTEYTGLFIPASNGTIYAYATKSGANDSELGSESIALPVVGDVVGDLLMTLQPDATPSGDATYASGYSKANYTLTIASEGSIKNSPMANYPNNFKISAGKDITITPPSNVTIQSIKIIGANNNSATDTKNVQVGSGFSIDGSAALMPKNVFVDDEQVMSEVVVKPNSASEGATVVFKLEKESRIYIKVYGTTSATTEPITPSKTYTTYIPIHNLDFTSASSLTAFIATAANSSNVTLTSVEKVPAGTPIVVKAAATGSPIAVNVTTTTDDVSSNLLKCGDGTTNVGGTKKYDYILSDGLFYRADEGTVAVGKAYLHLDSAPAAGAPAILRIEDEENNATSIQNIDDNVKVVKFIENGQLLIKRDGIVYDAMGRIVR